MADRLRFGTAGLRAAMGDGPMRMNEKTVWLAATAVAQWLPPASTVIVGHDHRHGSWEFSNLTVSVLYEHGHTVRVFEDPVPTPVVAHVIAKTSAAGGVVVTASHNPATDNGYKVYGAKGGQILPAAAAEIEANMAALEWPDEVAMVEHLAEGLFDPDIDDYLDAIARPVAPRPLRIAYTAMHGVGGDLFVRALEAAAHEVVTVAQQHQPDPDFPTAPFPNPEEPGTLDLVMALATEAEADLVMANDPDADRLAVAVPADSDWRRLSGDEIGVLLGWYLLDRSDNPRSVATTIVSSSLLGKVASARGATCHRTLTGFKWLMQEGTPVEPLVFAYEEALGYSVLPAIPDKDGISAAVVFAELASVLAAGGRTIDDLLDEIYAEHGVHLTSQVSVRFEGDDPMTAMTALMAQLRADPPDNIGGYDVTAVEDFIDGGDLPPSDVLMFHLDGGRLIVRPSGTEPKIKAYLEAVDGDRAAAELQLTQLTEGVSALLGRS